MTIWTRTHLPYHNLIFRIISHAPPGGQVVRKKDIPEWAVRQAEAQAGLDRTPSDASDAGRTRPSDGAADGGGGGARPRI